MEAEYAFKNIFTLFNQFGFWNKITQSTLMSKIKVTNIKSMKTDEQVTVLP